MPNTQEIQEAIESCKTPLVMVALSKGEVAAKRTELQAFTNGNGHFMVTNLGKMHSLFDGSLLSPVENASKKEIAGEDFQSLDDLVTMKSNPLDGTTEVPELIGVDADLAFALAGEEVFCPISGVPTKLEYHGEIAVDGEEGSDLVGEKDSKPLVKGAADDDGDDEEDITDVDMTDADDSDDDDNSDDDDVSSDAADDIEEDVDVGDPDDDDDTMELSADEGDDNPFTIAGTETKALLDKYEGLVAVYEEDGGEPSLVGGVVRVLTEDTFVVIDEEGNPYTVKATSIGDDGDAMKLVGTMQSAESASEQEVTASETAELEDNQVRLLSMTGKDNSEVAVFVGQTHAGTLHRSRASETAAPLFADGQKLFAAFKPTLRSNYDNQKSPELAKFGYVPQSFKVKVHKLFESRLQREVAKVSSTSETAAANQVNDFTTNLELAFVGINKGMFKDVKNDLATEIASLLKRNGVVGAELEARKLLARHSNSYVKGAVEQAKVLSTKSKDYLNGITEALAKADFVVHGETASAADIPSVIFDTPAPARKPEVAGFEEPSKPQGNRYASLVAGFRRR